MRMSLVRIVAISSCAGALGCGGTRTTPMEPTAAAMTVAATTGTVQIASAGGRVGLAPVVMVRDASGAPVPNVTVVFSVTAGGGEISPATVTTGANGVAAAATWTLGVVAGINTVSATIQGAEPAKFFAVAGNGTLPPPRTSRILNLTGRPFGVRVLSGNTAYVTRQDVNLASRVDAGTLASSTSLPTGGNPADIVYDRSGARGYVADVLGFSVAIVNISNGTLEKEVPVVGSAFRVAIAPSGDRVYVPMNNGQIAVLQTATGTLTNPINLSGPLNGIAFDQSGQRLYVSSMSGQIFVVDPASGQILNSRTVGGTGQEVVVSPDGSELYVANEAGWVDVLDTSTLNSKARVTIPEAFGMSLSPDGSKLWVSCTRIGVVFVLDRVTRTLVDGFYVTGLPRRIAFTSSGKALVANEGGWLDVLP